jgi:hypothetical protein
VYVTVALRDIKDEKIELTGTQLTFRGTSEGKQYAVQLELLHSVLPEVRHSPPLHLMDSIMGRRSGRLRRFSSARSLSLRFRPP